MSNVYRENLNLSVACISMIKKHAYITNLKKVKRFSFNVDLLPRLKFNILKLMRFNFNMLKRIVKFDMDIVGFKSTKLTCNNIESSIIIIGSSGHAKVCIELLQSMGKHIAYCVGDQNSFDECLGIVVLKGDESLISLRNQGYNKVFVAVGDNKLRTRLARYALEQGFQLINAISPEATISPSAKLGLGVAVMPGVIINAMSVIDDLSIINTGATIDHDCQIGRATHIAPQCALAGGVRVGKLSFLGIGTKVIPDVNIGDHVISGAGSVVIANILSNKKVMGVPAKIH